MFTNVGGGGMWVGEVVAGVLGKGQHSAVRAATTMVAHMVIAPWLSTA
jgi:hypothetical protein